MIVAVEAVPTLLLSWKRKGILILVLYENLDSDWEFPQKFSKAGFFEIHECYFWFVNADEESRRMAVDHLGCWN